MRRSPLCLAALLLSLLGPPSARAQEAPPTPPTPFPGTAFVGVTDDPTLFVAVVVGASEARAYLCDGRGLVAWFTGEAGDGQELNLRAEDGGRLTAALGADRLRGQAELADGQTVAFTAEPATGMAGLYEVVVGADGRVVGAAAGGLRLEGVVAGALPDGSLLVAGAVALPDGGVRPLAVFATSDAEGAQRWIVLGDGRVTGGRKRGEGSGFIDPVSDLAVPKDESFIDPTTDI